MANKPHKKGVLYHRHYKIIADETIKRFIQGKRQMFVWFPLETIFPEDFPYKRRMKEENGKALYKINVVKMLNWLYKEGRVEYNSSMLLKQVQAVNCRLLGMLNIGVLSKGAQNLKGEE